MTTNFDRKRNKRLLFYTGETISKLELNHLLYKFQLREVKNKIQIVNTSKINWWTIKRFQVHYSKRSNLDWRIFEFSVAVISKCAIRKFWVSRFTGVNWLSTNMHVPSVLSFPSPTVVHKVVGCNITRGNQK